MAEQAPLLTGLLPAAPAASVAEAVERMGLWERPPRPHARPRVLLNMVSTLDGRATLEGRSGAISGPADRALFHALRAAMDGVLVGAGTVRAERYGRLIRSEQTRRLRAERGLEPEPLACVVSGRLALDGDIPLLADPESRVAMITSSAASLPACQAQVEYVRAESSGQIDLARALEELGGRLGLGSVICEGGPHLARELFGAGLVDELHLSLAPMLAGGEPAAGQALRILAGTELEPPAGMTLAGVLQSDSCLFLRYLASTSA